MFTKRLRSRHILVDVRTNKEYKAKHIKGAKNVQAMDYKDYLNMKTIYPLAPITITRSIYRRQDIIREELEEIYGTGDREIIFYCSRGRLRSPLIYLYAKYCLKMKCKVLWGGIKKGKWWK
ncbi:MAG: rhodanese-like domain-containing protein [Clostridium sp.]|uniref:rhodanese-like domain-containing protein n=1 Tax=Clostridium sp. TaxID=1506 RepID=UPI003F3E510F